MKLPKIEGRRKLTQLEEMRERDIELSLQRGRIYGDYYSLSDERRVRRDDYPFDYRKSQKTTILTSYLGSDTEVIVPDMYYGFVRELDGTFADSRVEYILLPDSIVRISGRAFSGCESLTEIELPKKLEYLSDLAFEGCTMLRRVAAAPDNEKYYSVDGVLFERREKTLILYPEGRTDKHYAIPEGTERIGYRAFSNCRYLKTVVLPGSLKFIDPNACGGYSCSIEEFEVCDDNAFFSTDDGVLLSRDRSTLIMYPPDRQSERYTVPDCVERIGSFAFLFNRFLTDVILPENVTKIDEYAFVSLGINRITVLGNPEAVNDANAFGGVAPDLPQTRQVYCRKDSKPWENCASWGITPEEI